MMNFVVDNVKVMSFRLTRPVLLFSVSIIQLSSANGETFCLVIAVLEARVHALLGNHQELGHHDATSQDMTLYTAITCDVGINMNL